MSVRTTAHDELSAAEENVRDAIRHLNAILVDKCYGSDEYSSERRQVILKSHRLLMEALEVLG